MFYKARMFFNLLLNKIFAGHICDFFSCYKVNKPGEHPLKVVIPSFFPGVVVMDDSV